MKETIVKMNKTKSFFFDKINKIDKTLSQTHQEKKREKNQINKIRKQKGDITTDNAEIQRIIKDYYPREQHRNMYIIKCETDHRSRLDA